MTIFDRDVLIVLDDRADYGEDRFLGLGKLDLGAGGVVIVVAHTRRSGRIRIISARRANRKERKSYDAFIHG